MEISAGTLVDGRIDEDRGLGEADGTTAHVVSLDADDDAKPSAEELAELEAGIAEADRGELIPGNDLLAELGRSDRSRRDATSMKTPSRSREVPPGRASRLLLTDSEGLECC